MRHDFYKLANYIVIFIIIFIDFAVTTAAQILTSTSNNPSTGISNDSFGTTMQMVAEETTSTDDSSTGGINESFKTTMQAVADQSTSPNKPNKAQVTIHSGPPYRRLLMIQHQMNTSTRRHNLSSSSSELNHSSQPSMRLPGPWLSVSLESFVYPC